MPQPPPGFVLDPPPQASSPAPKHPTPPPGFVIDNPAAVPRPPSGFVLDPQGPGDTSGNAEARSSIARLEQQGINLPPDRRAQLIQSNLAAHDHRQVRPDMPAAQIAATPMTGGMGGAFQDTLEQKVQASAQGMIGMGVGAIGVADPEAARQIQQNANVQLGTPHTIGNTLAQGAGAAIPGTAAALGSGGAALPVALGITSGVGRGRIDAAQARADGREVSGAQEAATAAGYAGIEGTTAGIGAGVMKGAGKLIEPAAAGIVQRAAIAAGINIPTDVATSIAGQIAQNYVAKQAVDPERKLTEGVRDAAISGVASGVAGTVGSVVGSGAFDEWWNTRGKPKQQQDEPVPPPTPKDETTDTGRREDPPRPTSDTDADYERRKQEYRERFRREQRERERSRGRQEQGSSPAETFGRFKLDPNKQYTEAEVKSAIRREWLRTHPDRGGSADEFNKVQQDADRIKAYYESKGYAPEPAQPQQEQQAPPPPPEGFVADEPSAPRGAVPEQAASDEAIQKPAADAPPAPPIEQPVAEVDPKRSPINHAGVRLLRTKDKGFVAADVNDKPIGPAHAKPRDAVLAFREWKKGQDTAHNETVPSQEGAGRTSPPAEQAPQRPGGKRIKATDRDPATLSAEEFHSAGFYIHSDLRSGTQETRDAILRDGFRRAMNTNAAPVMRPDDNGPIARKYGPKPGKDIYLIPPEGIEQGANGPRVREGWKPKPNQIVRMREGETLHQAIVRQSQEQQSFDQPAPAAPGGESQSAPPPAVTQATEPAPATQVEQRSTPEAARPDPFVGAPGYTPANGTTPATETPDIPRSQRPPVKRNPGKFSREGIERALEQHYDEMGQSANDAEIAAQQDTATFTKAGPFTFPQKGYPEELTGALTPNELKQAKAKGIIRTSEGAHDPAGAEDAMKEVGQDAYADEVRRRLGDTNAGKRRRAITFGQKSNDPKMRLYAQMHEVMRTSGDGKKKGTVSPAEQPIGTKFKFEGHDFEIIEDEDGNRILRDGEAFDDVPADAIDEMPVDKGSVKAPSEDGLPQVGDDPFGEFKDEDVPAPPAGFEVDKADVPHQFVKPGDDRSRGVTLAPSAKQKGKWQVTYFDVDGFSGDQTFDTNAQAQSDIVRDGFRPAKRDQLADLSKTDKFRVGNEKTRLVGMMNEVRGADAHARLAKAYETGGLEAARKEFQAIKNPPQPTTPEEAPKPAAALSTGTAAAGGKTGLFGQPDFDARAGAQESFGFKQDDDAARRERAKTYAPEIVRQQFDPTQLSDDKGQDTETGKMFGEEPADDLKAKIRAYLAKKPNASLRDIGDAVGVKPFGYGSEGKPLDNPLNKALTEMRDAGHVQANEKSHGDPTFQLSSRAETPQGGRQHTDRSLEDFKRRVDEDADRGRQKLEEMRAKQGPLPPLGMDGKTRAQRKGDKKLPTPPIHPNSIKSLDAAMENRDVSQLASILHSGNKGLRAMFSERTGVALPKTEGGTREAIREWVRQKIDERYEAIEGTTPEAPEITSWRDLPTPIQSPLQKVFDRGHAVDFNKGEVRIYADRPSTDKTWSASPVVSSAADALLAAGYTQADLVDGRGYRLMKFAPPEQPAKKGKLPPRRGAINITPLEPVATAIKAGAQLARAGVNLAVRDVVDRVAAKDKPVAKRAADLGRKAINTSKAALGKLAPKLDAAMTAAGAGISPSLHRANAALQTVTRAPGKEYGVARILDAVEGRVAHLSPAETRVIAAIRDLTDATGRMFQANKHLQYDAKSDTWKPFVNRGGDIFVRHSTPEFMGILMKGDGPLWNAAVDAFADINGIPRPTIEAMFTQQRNDLLGADGPKGAFSRINAEFTRQLPRVPTHLYTGGDSVPLFETNPFAYSKRLAEHAAARTGFIAHFGQETDPTTSTIAKLRTDYARENGEGKTLVDMMRALNMIPLETPVVDAGSELGKMLRGLRYLGDFTKAGLLTASTIQNIPEPLGNTLAFGGAGNMLRAAAKLTTSPRATIATLEALGAVTKDVANLAFNPNRPFESVLRVLREASGRAFLHKYVNELQEKLAAAVAMEKVERMRAGKGNSLDEFDMKWLGFDAATAKRLAAGTATPGEYDNVVRRAPTMLVGNPMGAAERTRMSHNRIYRATIAFEGYAQAKIRSFLKIAEAYGPAMASGDPKQMYAANRKLAAYVAGTAASGALAYFLMALATGGTMGLDIALHEAKDEPAKFLGRSFLYTTLAGPYGAVVRTASEGRGNAFEQLIRATFPGFVIGETYDAIAGKGAYRDLDGMDAAAKLGERFLPINRVYGQAKAALGYGRDEQALETAIRGYWRWRFDVKPPSNFEGNKPDEAHAEFRRHMKKAYGAMKAGQQDVAERETAAALAVKGAGGTVAPSKAATATSESIRSRKLLAQLKGDEPDQLRRRIGDKAFEKLEAHDKVLEDWATSVKPKPRKKL